MCQFFLGEDKYTTIKIKCAIIKSGHKGIKNKYGLARRKYTLSKSNHTVINHKIPPQGRPAGKPQTQNAKLIIKTLMLSRQRSIIIIKAFRSEGRRVGKEC